jgi:hypothetical protein
LVYRSGDVAILRDQLVLRDTVTDFDPNDPYKSIRERDAKQTVSEWTVPIELIEQFLLPAA